MVGWRKQNVYSSISKVTNSLNGLASVLVLSRLLQICIMEGDLVSQPRRTKGKKRGEEKFLIIRLHKRSIP